MAADVHGFEEHGDGVPHVCITCDGSFPWPGAYQCHGCLVAGVKPADTWTCRTVHYDTAVLQAIIRRKVAQWEQACPGWVLVPDMQRYWEDATHPSKYVDRETLIGRKLAWTRFRVERRHPRGVSVMGQVGGNPGFIPLEQSWWQGQTPSAGPGWRTVEGVVVVSPTAWKETCMAEPTESDVPEEEPTAPEVEPAPEDVPDPEVPPGVNPVEEEEAPA